MNKAFSPNFETPDLFQPIAANFLVTLWAADPKITGNLRPRSAACEASFSDATAAVRRLLWSAECINIPARHGWRGNSSRPLGET
jgi:hypothetical protein